MRWGQIATGAIAISALAFFALIVGQSQSIQWSEIPRYLVDPSILRGVLLTLELTAGAMVFGIVLGCLLALMATSQNPVLKVIAAGFVWWFRGVPLIVQIFFWFNIALFIPQVGMGSFTISINDLVTPAWLASSHSDFTKPRTCRRSSAAAWSRSIAASARRPRRSG